MELKVKNAAGEMRAIDIDASDTAIINGAQGPTTSLLDWLTADERRELDEWCNNQTPSPNGSIAMNAWPGWHDVAFRRFADTARNYRPNIQTVTQCSTTTSLSGRFCSAWSTWLSRACCCAKPIRPARPGA